MRILGRTLAFVVIALMPALAAAAPATAAEPGDGPVVRVGTEGTYPPFTFNEGGELTG